jgi:hypothetical protein
MEHITEVLAVMEDIKDVAAVLVEAVTNVIAVVVEDIA